MFGASPYSEPAHDWIILRHQDFAGLTIDEHESLEIVSALAQGLHGYGPAFAAWAQLDERDPERLAEFAEHYRGYFDSAEDYAQELIDSLGWPQELDERLEQPLRQYARIDIAQLSRDLQTDSHITIVPALDGGVWVFDGLRGALR